MGDIDGTKTKKLYVRNTQYDSFNYADITKAKFATTRTVNPLAPQYVVRDDKNEIITIGDV